MFPTSYSNDPVVVLAGARRLPRADILVDNKRPGLFSRFSTTHLGGLAIAGALEHTKIDPKAIGHVVMGMAQHSHRDSIYGAQGMRARAGLPNDVPALTVARICGSGAEAIAVATEMMQAGLRHDAERPFTVAGGAESMQYPFCLYSYRGKAVGGSTQKYGPIDVKALPPGTHLQDMLLMSLYDPSANMAMANTAEELARRYGITREQCDAFGFRSQKLAKQARDAGWFLPETVPVVVEDEQHEPRTIVHDTHVMEDVSLEGMARLRAAFEAGGVITAGNASAVVDGAAAMVLGRESDAKAHGYEPLARLVGMGVAACDPAIMGWGPVPATKRALAGAGITGAQIDHVELNEAFAPQALAVIRDFEAMGIDPERVNPQGGAIALGHPLGATGAILTVSCAHALRRKGQRYGLVTMCIGGGQGISLVIEGAVAGPEDRRRRFEVDLPRARARARARSALDSSRPRPPPAHGVDALASHRRPSAWIVRCPATSVTVGRSSMHPGELAASRAAPAGRSAMSQVPCASLRTVASGRPSTVAAIVTPASSAPAIVDGAPRHAGGRRERGPRRCRRGRAVTVARDDRRAAARRHQPHRVGAGGQLVPAEAAGGAEEAPGRQRDRCRHAIAHDRVAGAVVAEEERRDDQIVRARAGQRHLADQRAAPRRQRRQLGRRRHLGRGQRAHHRRGQRERVDGPVGRLGQHQRRAAAGRLELPAPGGQRQAGLPVAIADRAARHHLARTAQRDRHVGQRRAGARIDHGDRDRGVDRRWRAGRVGGGGCASVAARRRRVVRAIVRRPAVRQRADAEAERQADPQARA
jgi:acetyl-CoA acetyltransferase family protein